MCSPSPSLFSCLFSPLLTPLSHLSNTSIPHSIPLQDPHTHPARAVEDPATAAAGPAASFFPGQDQYRQPQRFHHEQYRGNSILRWRVTVPNFLRSTLVRQSHGFWDETGRLEHLTRSDWILDASRVVAQRKGEEKQGTQNTSRSTHLQPHLQCAICSNRTPNKHD